MYTCAHSHHTHREHSHTTHSVRTHISTHTARRHPRPMCRTSTFKPLPLINQYPLLPAAPQRNVNSTAVSSLNAREHSIKRRHVRRMFSRIAKRMFTSMRAMMCRRYRVCVCVEAS